MPTKAAALKYDASTKEAPKVVAAGKGELAKKIIEKAKEHNVPLFANAMLVDSLIELDIDAHIPQKLYGAVVDVFVWLMKNEKRYKELQS
ncbi:MAG: EscU/YscU/HrcU family type III secretion system export apparatus switch protein [Epsilonproteobacteria bacterium]|nr:EscU/YscU/HrcU family type III secretion system export apparatus switch protein [Campylobacterota bacterium]